MKYPDTRAFKFAVDYLNRINVTFRDIAEICKMNQEKYSNKDLDYYENTVVRVLHKREVLNHLMVMAFLDDADKGGFLPSPLNDIIHNDMGCFGVDESLALGGSQIFGSIAITNYSYIDKTKPLKIGELDSSNGATTFADDIVGMICACVIAHSVHELA